MQKITREQLIEKAIELLENGTVSCVLGWEIGEFDYDVTPAMFNNEEELEHIMEILDSLKKPEN